MAEFLTLKKAQKYQIAMAVTDNHLAMGQGLWGKILLHCARAE